MRRHGPLGENLFDCLGHVADRMQGLGHNLGETYVLGDSPLVLLTALTSLFHPDTSSSRFVTRRCSRILDDGTYEPRPDNREVRIYTALDNRLTLTDLYAKLELHAIASGKGP